MLLSLSLKDRQRSAVEVSTRGLQNLSPVVRWMAIEGDAQGCHPIWLGCHYRTISALLRSQRFSEDAAEYDALSHVL